VAEDIEAKIRRLRELGKATAESETPVVKPSSSPPKRPAKRPRSIGSIRDRERRRRILIGAAVLIILLLVVSVGAYTYVQNRKAAQLKELKAQKINELNSYFSSYNFSNKDCSQKAYEVRSLAIGKIQATNDLDELRNLDVRVYFDKAVQVYQECLREQQRLEYEMKLNQTKQEKLREIRMAFQPLLSMPLPDSIRIKAVSAMKTLEEKVMNAKSLEEVQSISPDPYLLTLWRDYYLWKIDTIPGDEVVLEKAGEKMLVSKDEAKALISGITDYRELILYKVYRAQYVEIALVLPRERIAGGFIMPGDEVVIFTRNGTAGDYIKVVSGRAELVLLPTTAGQISVSESQSQSSSTSSSTSTSYSESSSTTYNPGGTTFSNGTTSSSTYTNSQSASQSSSASYSYNVNLAEILKAIAAGKIQASDEAREALESYGWRVVDLERSSDMLVLPPGTEFLVIIRVPEVFVPDILQNQAFIYIARVAG